MTTWTYPINATSVENKIHSNDCVWICMSHWGFLQLENFTCFHTGLIKETGRGEKKKKKKKTQTHTHTHTHIWINSHSLLTPSSWHIHKKNLECTYEPAAENHIKLLYSLLIWFHQHLLLPQLVPLASLPPAEIDTEFWFKQFYGKRV